MVVVAVVLLYTTALLALREGDGPIGFMALRGAQAEGLSASTTDGDDSQEREEVEEWDPLPAPNYGERGPVKGGVEVYPLQVCPSLCYYWCSSMMWILSSFRRAFFHHPRRALVFCP